MSNSSLGKFRFEEDGVAYATNLSSCGEQGGMWETHYEWEQREGSTISIELDSMQEWRFSPNGCGAAGVEAVRWERLINGEVLGTYDLFRADMCLERFDCNGDNDELQCEDCRTIWCDEPPPPCSPD